MEKVVEFLNRGRREVSQEGRYIVEGLASQIRTLKLSRARAMVASLGLRENVSSIHVT